eukprot:55274_1
MDDLIALYLVIVFVSGVIVACICSCCCAYKLSGYENKKQCLFATFMKYKSVQHRKGSSWRLSSFVPIRPSNECVFIDELFYGALMKGDDAKTKREEYLNTSIREKVDHFKQITARQATDIYPSMLPFGPNEELINKYIQEMDINGFRSLKVNYPGTANQSKHDTVSIVVHFHGASGIGGSPEMFRSYLVLLSMITNSTCYSMGFGLAPDYTVLDQVDHAINAYKYILNEYSAQNIKVFLGGHSNGGCLTLLALQKMMKNKDIRQPDGAIIISANVDRSYDGETFITHKDRDSAVDKEVIMPLEHVVVGNMDMDGNWKDKEKQIDLKDPRISPLYAEVKGLCDLYFHVGLNECLLSQNQAFIEKCLENGVSVEYEFDPWLPHIGPLICDTVPEARDAVVRIAQWMKQRISAQNSKILNDHIQEEEKDEEEQ